MTYIHIPVDFEHPTDQNFEDFKDAIERNPEAQMHVHCIYNARVSAFLFRYAKTSADIREDEALAIMESIWRRGDDWAIFIDKPDVKGLPNRYGGKDY